MPLLFRALTIDNCNGVHKTGTTDHWVCLGFLHDVCVVGKLGLFIMLLRFDNGYIFQNWGDINEHNKEIDSSFSSRFTYFVMERSLLQCASTCIDRPETLVGFRPGSVSGGRPCSLYPRSGFFR